MFRELPLIVLISANFAFSGSIQNLPALPNGAVASAVQVDASGNILFSRLHGCWRFCCEALTERFADHLVDYTLVRGGGSDRTPEATTLSI